MNHCDPGLSLFSLDCVCHTFVGLVCALAPVITTSLSCFYAMVSIDQYRCYFLGSTMPIFETVEIGLVVLFQGVQTIQWFISNQKDEIKSPTVVLIVEIQEFSEEFHFQGFKREVSLSMVQLQSIVDSVDLRRIPFRNYKLAVSQEKPPFKDLIEQTFRNGNWQETSSESRVSCRQKKTKGKPCCSHSAPPWFSSPVGTMYHIPDRNC
jgi:hypothetical protein